MNLKRLIDEGIIISYPFKNREEDWVGESKIYKFSGGWGIIPKIIIEIPNEEIGGRREFSLSDIDKAVEIYEKYTFSDKNFWWKVPLAISNLSKDNKDLDLEDEKSYNLVMNERNRLRLKK